MIVLNRAYNGFPTGTIVEFTAELEAALIAQGLAATSAGPITPGAQSTTPSPNVMANILLGTASVAIGAASVTVTNSNITANSKGFAQVSQAAADATALRVERVSAAAGVVTITVTAAATAATEVSYMIAF